MERLEKSWPDLLDRLTKILPQAHQYLIDTTPLKVTETHVTIGIDPEFAQEKRSLQTQRTISFIQRELERFLKRSVAVNFKVMTGKAATRPLPTDHFVEEKADRSKYYNNPAVESVLNAFSGSIDDIRR